LVGGQIVSDIQDFNRVNEMLYRLQPRHVKENEQIEGFGFAFTLRDYLANIGNLATLQDLPNLPATSRADAYPGLKAGVSKMVAFKPMFGIFNQHKWCPLRYAGGYYIGA
jgi:hypothetical protein